MNAVREKKSKEQFIFSGNGLFNCIGGQIYISDAIHHVPTEIVFGAILVVEYVGSQFKF